MSDQQDKPASAVPELHPPADNKTPETPVEPEQKPEEPTPNANGVDGIQDQPAKDNTPTEASETPVTEHGATQGEQEATHVDNKPKYLSNNPALSEFFDRLPSILSTTGYAEMWGVSLKEDSADVPTVNVLIKFLRANEGNVKLAEDQLTKALQWRKEMNPSALAESGTYCANKFGGLGYVTIYKDANGKETVTTWNIYGAVKNIDATFGDMDEFVKWRVALMEMAVKDLKMNEATAILDYDGEDPYQMIQVHDYLNVSFLRINPNLRAATKKTIEVFATAYPELLCEKFFVNVPAIMGWMFAAMKVFLSKNTTRKFHPISNGANLAREFPAPLKEQFPKVYGGSAGALQEDARTVTLVADPDPIEEEPTEKKDEAPEAEFKEQPKEASAETPADAADAAVTAAPATAEAK
ncbi:Non-classical phosphatidylinositol transfer protein (PITP) [Aspergillus nanangensis]|uniref:Phosphatidylinositol transfer protein SFH5 n=1 Tax=Aspergillus nanangensis TaxID=2582783 RepID=A0AAD4CCG5_ASPNN|nr:Non-classical phosphatidylinositol transfer protein (PITP) [Aspergillus nanangensis]